MPSKRKVTSGKKYVPQGLQPRIRSCCCTMRNKSRSFLHVNQMSLLSISAQAAEIQSECTRKKKQEKKKLCDTELHTRKPSLVYKLQWHISHNYVFIISTASHMQNHIQKLKQLFLNTFTPDGTERAKWSHSWLGSLAALGPLLGGGPVVSCEKGKNRESLICCCSGLLDTTVPSVKNLNHYTLTKMCLWLLTWRKVLHTKGL